MSESPLDSLLLLLKNLFGIYNETEPVPGQIDEPHACVAAILRLTDLQSQCNVDGFDDEQPPMLKQPFDLLFMLRSARPNDRWSGQVSFPGGRSKKGESLQQTVIREVWEEIGLNLSEKKDYELLGKMGPATPVLIGKREMKVHVFVYFQKTACTPSLNLDDREVSDVQWVNFSQLVSPPLYEVNPFARVKSALPVPRGKEESTLRPHNTFKFSHDYQHSHGLNQHSLNHCYLRLGWKLADWMKPLPFQYPEWLLWGLTYHFTAHILNTMKFKHYLKTQDNKGNPVKTFIFFLNKIGIIKVKFVRLSHHRTSKKKKHLSNDVQNTNTPSQSTTNLSQNAVPVSLSNTFFAASKL
ncbi:hypothetical protein RFI_18896 [Reticulomyxa filosa]|uniref:Nudix hydrolase domain-containing protein n=1 Tax=Reticulomyxa filosa TaxID=46433 RepID=X6MXQ6_RETFI|nr:hypothetical protein RFI_18896 [Reticulomyxa filosa]|eukprot:ETO18376.1 hypothetical protein RFI_18896 [Reticulomyxa filosa]